MQSKQLVQTGIPWVLLNEVLPYSGFEQPEQPVPQSVHQGYPRQEHTQAGGFAAAAPSRPRQPVARLLVPVPMGLGRRTVLLLLRVPLRLTLRRRPLRRLASAQRWVAVSVGSGRLRRAVCHPAAALAGPRPAQLLWVFMADRLPIYKMFFVIFASKLIS
eukprot:Selendium_serpulae@DN5633_c0_g1_i3.p1